MVIASLLGTLYNIGKNYHLCWLLSRDGVTQYRSRGTIQVYSIVAALLKILVVVLSITPSIDPSSRNKSNYMYSS